MVDPPSEPQAGDQIDVNQAADGPPATPRWAKLFWIIAAVVILLFLIALVTSGPHGPGRHGDGSGGETSSSGVTEHRPPQSIRNHGG